MSVISFPVWRVFWFQQGEQNAIGEWLASVQATPSDRAALQALIDLTEAFGPRSVSHAVTKLGDRFQVLRSKAGSGGLELRLVFCQGPFGENEITFLAGALFDSKEKKMRPHYVLGIAEENLEALEADRKRRRRERIS